MQRNLVYLVGDKVLLTPNFDTTIYVVTARKGNLVEVSSGDKVLHRNVGHLKKIPTVIAPLRPLAFSSTNRTISESIDPRNSSSNIEYQSTTPGNLQSKTFPEEKVSTGEKDLKIRLKNIGGMWQSILNNQSDPCKNEQ